MSGLNDGVGISIINIDTRGTGVGEETRTVWNRLAYAYEIHS